MRPFKVRVAADVPNDLALIEQHLFKSYQEFGDDLQNATTRAATRINEALAYVCTFKTHPHRGESVAKLTKSILAGDEGDTVQI